MDRDETNQSPTRQGELRESRRDPRLCCPARPSSRMDTFMNEHTLLDLLALGVLLWLI